MARDEQVGYEASLGPHVPIEVPYDRLEDATPTVTEHKPACVLGVDGSSLTGTIVTLDAATSVAVINIAKGACYYHQVRNVLTYAAAVEATWGQLNFGTPVYYDPSATMPAGVYLSLSPLDNAGAANTLFGWCAWSQTEIPDPFRGDTDPYPLGTAGVASTHEDVVIVQA